MNEELLKRLDLLAAKLNVTATVLWAALIRQARVEAIQDTIYSVTLLLVVGGLIKVIHWRWKSDDSHDDGGLVLACGIAAIVLFVMFLLIASCIPTEFLNPEYFALTRLLEKLK